MLSVGLAAASVTSVGQGWGARETGPGPNVTTKGAGPPGVGRVHVLCDNCQAGWDAFELRHADHGSRAGPEYEVRRGTRCNLRADSAEFRGGKVVNRATL